MSTFTFLIIGKNDNPLYEIEFPITVQKKETYVLQYIAHGALDIVEEHVWKSNNMYLKIIDKFNKVQISSFVTAGHEDAIKNFFVEVHDLYLKILLNPFYEYNKPITSTAFDAKVRKIGTKYF
ncbi:hypothetical protein ACTFIR_000994 [Dictyostelium discoideum]